MSTRLAAHRASLASVQSALIGNRLQGSGAGAGMLPTIAGWAAAGNQGAYTTANATTWTDITNTSFTIVLGRTVQVKYLIRAAGHLSAAGALGYVRGSIVNYDNTAAIEFGTTGTSTGAMEYMALSVGKGPVAPGSYTVKLQAATDNNTFSITVDEFFHWIELLG